MGAYAPSVYIKKVNFSQIFYIDPYYMYIVLYY